MERHRDRKPGLLRLLVRALLPSGPPSRRLLVTGLALAALLPLGAVYAMLAQPTTSRSSAPDFAAPAVEPLLARAEAARGVWRDVERYVEREVVPIERVLLRYREDPDLARRIALGLVREAREVGLEPRLFLAVLLVENPYLDPSARSPVGARGLMQVMPLHLGNWPCEPDLEDIEANLCHGVRIFAHYYRQTGGDVERALLRYNGCVNGTNTPDCHRYPYHVYARAGRASILAWLKPRPGMAAAP